jgi:transketolase
MRNAFANTLTELATHDDRIVLLSGDIGNRMFDRFKAACPGRFFNCGVAEANMMSMAAGLAMNGLRPVVYTITPFVTTRCLEQIRVDVCYHHVPVVIVGVGGGLSYASLGATHHSCEDIAFLRALPNMQVVCPGDAWETQAAFKAALGQDEPVYLRLGKKGEPQVHASEPSFEIGRAITIQDGSDTAILSTGNLLPTAVEAARLLAADDISTRVVSFHTVKPLDEGCLAETFERARVVATLEEHSVLGGFGSAVCEWLADQVKPRARLMRIGTADTFLHEAGDQAYARARNKLTAPQIAQRIREAID